MRHWFILRPCILLLGLFLGSNIAAEAVPLKAIWDPNPEPDISGYVLSYGSSSGVHPTQVIVGNVTICLLDLSPGQRYYFVLQAFNTLSEVSLPSVEVFVDVGGPFADSPLIIGVTPIKAMHVTDLRVRIDGVRVARGLAAFSWVEAVAISTTATAQHVIEMRTALGQAYVVAAMTAPVYTDPALGAGMPIKAVHFTQLRDAVIAIETAP